MSNEKQQTAVEWLEKNIRLDMSPFELTRVLYRLWEQDNEGYTDFNLYYLNKMEKFIDWIKNKLT